MLGYIRFIITLLAAVIFFIIGLPVGLVALVMTKVAPEKVDGLVYPFVKWGLRFVAAATGCKVTVIGEENIPRDRAVLFTSNHRSIFDIVFTVTRIPGRFTAIAKKELSKIGILRFWMNRIHCLFLDRSDLRAGVKMVSDAAELLKSGISVYICPEGTRNRTEGTLLDFKGGSFKIGIRAGAPVVPVTVIGTGDVFEDHFPRIKARPVTIIFDKPIETSSLTIPERKELHTRVQQIVADNYAKYDKQ